MFEVEKQIVEQLMPLKAAALEAMANPVCKDRARAAAETLWRFQKMAAHCARLTVISRRAVWQWRWPIRSVKTVETKDAVIGLRKALTGDELYDLTTPPEPSNAKRIEEAIGYFVAGVDAAISTWTQATYGEG